MVKKMLLLWCLLTFSSLAWADSLAPLITRIAREERIPAKLLQTIVRLESDGRPWTLNVQGKAYFFQTRFQAETFLIRCLQQGIRNIDVGLSQINVFWHGKYFAHLQDMLHPVVNLRYAARLLRHHSVSSGSWMKGALLYHSSVSAHQSLYRKKLRQLLIKGKPA